MFTGIVEELGTVTEATGSRLALSCETVARDTPVGSSVAVNGACLTAVESRDGTLAFDLSPETLARTALGRLRAGDRVNLERPLTLSARLDGHLVQGHVDGVGRVASVRPTENGSIVTVEIPEGLSRYLVEKGSVAVDGVSLTVTALDEDRFDVALVPHTLEATILGNAEAGDAVNLEVDMIAKYVERALAAHGTGAANG